MNLIIYTILFSFYNNTTHLPQAHTKPILGSVLKRATASGATASATYNVMRMSRFIMCSTGLEKNLGF